MESGWTGKADCGSLTLLTSCCSAGEKTFCYLLHFVDWTNLLDVDANVAIHGDHVSSDLDGMADVKADSTSLISQDWFAMFAGREFDLSGRRIQHVRKQDTQDAPRQHIFILSMQSSEACSALSFALIQ